MFQRRALRQLLVVWGVALLLAAGLYRIEVGVPALHDMVLPVYWVVAGIAGFLTLRWLRARNHGDRRGKDRRRTERREGRATGEEK